MTKNIFCKPKERKIRQTWTTDPAAAEMSTIPFNQLPWSILSHCADALYVESTAILFSESVNYTLHVPFWTFYNSTETVYGNWFHGALSCFFCYIDHNSWGFKLIVSSKNPRVVWRIRLKKISLLRESQTYNKNMNTMFYKVKNYIDMAKLESHLKVVKSIVLWMRSIEEEISFSIMKT